MTHDEASHESAQGARPDRRVQIVVLVVPLLTSIGLAALLVWQAISGPLDHVSDERYRGLLAAGVVVTGRFLAWMSVGCLAGIALARRTRWRGAGLGLSLGWVAMVGLYSLIDLQIRKVSGRKLSEYFTYLFEPDATTWVGELGPSVVIAAFGPLLLKLGVVMAVATAIGVALAWRSPSPRARTALIAVWAGLLLLFGLRNQVWADASRYARLLDGRTTIDCPGSAQRCERKRLHMQGLIAALYKRYEPAPAELTYPTPRLVGRDTDAELPDVWLVIVESFRRDGLTQESAPRLWALSDAGARFENHYAGSNASHGGIFSILFGRPPIRYYPTIEQGVRPNLNRILEQVGYGTHFVTGSKLEWQGMEGYLSKPHFGSVDSIDSGEVWRRDRRSLARSVELLQAGSGPSLVVTFLMSTHFPYVYPDGFDRFAPVIPQPSALHPELVNHPVELRNRFLNASFYVDHIVGEALEGLDLDETLVVITGDHGESIFDDGTLGHASRFSESQLAVPLVIAGPDVRPGRVIAHPTSSTDIAATIFARLGLEVEAQPGIDLLDPTQRRAVLVSGSPPPAALTETFVVMGPSKSYLFDLYTRKADAYYYGRLDENGVPRMSEHGLEDTPVALGWIEGFMKQHLVAPTRGAARAHRRRP